jgi:hypothetical protein
MLGFDVDSQAYTTYKIIFKIPFKSMYHLLKTFMIAFS